MIKHLTNRQLAATLATVRAFEERAGAALYVTSRNANSTMTNFSNDNERHPAVIRWLQAVGRGSSVRLEAQTRLQRASVVASEDHAVIEALTRLPAPTREETMREVDAIVGPVRLDDYRDAHADDAWTDDEIAEGERCADDVAAAWSEMGFSVTGY